MNLQFAREFCARLDRRDPSAIASLRKLGKMHYAGNPQATQALRQLALHKQNYQFSGQSFVGDTFVGAGPLHLVTAPIAWVTKLLGSALTTTGNLAQHAGTIVAKPLHWGGQKLTTVAHNGIHLPMLHH